MGIKLLHTADLHLDRPFIGLGARRLNRRAEMRARFEEILGIAREKGAAALLIAGDLFDRPAADSANWVKAQMAAACASGLRIFLIPGNHDSLDDCAFYRGDFPPGVHVFVTPGFSICKDLPGINLYGLAYQPAKRWQNPLEGLSLEAGARWQLGLVHGQVRSTELIGQDYAPIEPAAIAGCGLDYLALGHYHTFHDCSEGRTRAMYPGSPHRLDFGDTAERHLLLVELNESGLNVEPIPLPDRQFLQIQAEADRPQNVYEQLLKAAGPEVYIRVRLYGRAGEPVAGLAADLAEKFADRCYGFEVLCDGTTMVAPESQAGTVAHAFARKMAERLRTSTEGADADLVRLATDYGLLALGGRQLP